ncbi:MAG: Stp1/IreP family PP2C-type Ser/Thr phosphatase [Candidatus Binatales bacterium]
MITCPECGFAANDGAKFCDRCGQGLSRAAAAPPSLRPLKPGAILKGGFQIVELLGASSVENRYRATRSFEGRNESLQLRERKGPAEAEASEEPAVPESPSGADSAASSVENDSQQDPNGPRAKTRELKLPKDAKFSAQTTDQIAPASGDSTAHSEVQAEVHGTESPSDSPPAEEASRSEPITLTEVAAESAADGPDGSAGAPAPPAIADPADDSAAAAPPLPSQLSSDDLGEVFGRVLGLSLTIKHPAFQCALSGFAQNGRVYLVYRDETLVPLAQRVGGIRMSEPEAIGLAIQVCQAVSALHRRGLRVNDICPQSVVVARDGRVKLTGLDYVSNDTELQSDPILNDGYTAPEIYKGRRADKRADVFSVGALLYTCLTGERIEAESWREEAGTVNFYPPHVVSPGLEQVMRRALAFSPDERWPTVEALKTELIKLNGTIRIRAAALTDVGRVRELNEDAVMAVQYSRQSQIEPAESYLYVIADGMGGAAAGEVASAIAVKAIRDYVEDRLAAGEASEPDGLLKEALEEANRRILDYQAANPESRGMGSTGVSALILPPEAAVAWVGDSRAYLSEGSAIRQLTKDHSLVQRLIEIGQLTPEQARSHEHKNVITRSLGARQSGPAGAEAIAIRLKRGDRMVLCSDGLTTHVEDGQIAEIVRQHSDPDAVARELIVAANAGGGTDNISAVVIFAE